MEKAHNRRKHCLCMLILLSLLLYPPVKDAWGCAACVAAGKLANETNNRAFYALRILYEKKGRAALPLFRRALALDDNPAAQMRAAGYVAELNDTESIPQLEGILSELLKRVSFSRFGPDTMDYRRRWIAAYALGTLGASGMCERIWERYDRFTLAKKREVPQILSALGDPQLTEHLLYIINGCEEHRLMLTALEALAQGGNAEAVVFLRAKVTEWETTAADHPEGMVTESRPDYFVLSRKAAQVVPRIEERLRSETKEPAFRKNPAEKKESSTPAYF